MSSISSSKIIHVVISDPRIFLCIATSAADASAGNPNGMKTFLANNLSTFFIKGKAVFSNGPRILPKNSPDFTIFIYFIILADELFGKTLQGLENCL